MKTRPDMIVLAWGFGATVLLLVLDEQFPHFLRASDAVALFTVLLMVAFNLPKRHGKRPAEN